jgi:hypothetical protein
MSKFIKVQILERARAMIEDERHWCRGDLARDAMDAYQTIKAAFWTELLAHSKR